MKIQWFLLCNMRLLINIDIIISVQNLPIEKVFVVIKEITFIYVSLWVS